MRERERGREGERGRGRETERGRKRFSKAVHFLFYITEISALFL